MALAVATRVLSGGRPVAAAARPRRGRLRRRRRARRRLGARDGRRRERRILAGCALGLDRRDRAAREAGEVAAAAIRATRVQLHVDVAAHARVEAAEACEVIVLLDREAVADVVEVVQRVERREVVVGVVGSPGVLLDRHRAADEAEVVEAVEGLEVQLLDRERAADASEIRQFLEAVGRELRALDGHRPADVVAALCGPGLRLGVRRDGDRVGALGGPGARLRTGRGTEGARLVRGVQQESVCRRRRCRRRDRVARDAVARDGREREREAERNQLDAGRRLGVVLELRERLVGEERRRLVLLEIIMLLF
mmetsp:Transcript_20241/g.60444  ORF Transcript_20241/g.60444 Transcript_20241/m.60444 type:complete len:310 (+) Transcript_20241:317-1246(+)